MWLLLCNTYELVEGNRPYGIKNMNGDLIHVDHYFDGKQKDIEINKRNLLPQGCSVSISPRESYAKPSEEERQEVSMPGCVCGMWSQAGVQRAGGGEEFYGLKDHKDYNSG